MSGDQSFPLTFDYQPLLHGDLVELRPLHANDYDALYGVAADPLIWEQHPDKTRHQPAGFHAFFDEALASGAPSGRWRRSVRSVMEPGGTVPDVSAGPSSSRPPGRTR